MPWHKSPIGHAEHYSTWPGPSPGVASTTCLPIGTIDWIPVGCPCNFLAQ